ncbi:MAG: hypothetical protein ACLP9L_00495, partial [Thermoguttaceae bacterium]
MAILKHPGSWRECSWRDYFIALDITSIAALTLALFFTWLAYCGIRNTAWRRYWDGKAFFEHVYDTGLFSKSFASLCIQFGLLGTLLSFLLAAVAQIGAAISDTSTTHDAPIVAESALAKDVKAVVHASPNRDASREDVSDGDRLSSNEKATPKPRKELSSDIFLLLCASLVSAFVGAFVAYIVIPPLNLLNDCAIGVFQLDYLDEESTAEEFFRQVERTSRRLTEFDKATSALTGAAEGVQRFHVASADASKTFARMMEMLGRVAELTEASNHRADALTTSLTSFQQQSERVLLTFRGFAIDFKRPWEEMLQLVERMNNASVAGRFAFQELQEMAKEIRAPLDTA